MLLSFFLLLFSLAPNFLAPNGQHLNQQEKEGFMRGAFRLIIRDGCLLEARKEVDGLVIENK